MAPSTRNKERTRMERYAITRSITDSLDGSSAARTMRQQAEKHVAKIIVRHAFVKSTTGKYGLPRGKGLHIFEEMAAGTYSDLNIGWLRIKHLVYKLLRDMNHEATVDDMEDDSDDDIPEVSGSLLHCGGFEKTLL